MLTLKDCIAMSGLTREEVDAIAEHEHVPEIIAAEMADYLVHQSGGIPCIRRIILDDIEAARRQGNVAHAARLKLVLQHFVKTYSEAG
jgi:hypothetical protein